MIPITLSNIPKIIEALPLPRRVKLEMHIDNYNALIDAHPFIFMGRKRLDKVEILEKFGSQEQ